ncbi:MAG: hypothetical protein JSW46_05405 [Gemmatimonadota bacterium]|nr:MAG: hypothetical protein JSW46_05405 [Gemmatimonadota bacterium]
MNTSKDLLIRGAFVSLLLSFMAACGDDATGPQFQLTPESTADIMEQLVADFFDGNDAAISFEGLGASILTALGGGGPSAALEAASPAEFEGGIPDELLRFPVYRAAANIPDIFQGLTFEWDEQLGEYTAGERSGAPTTGARFILYAVNPITGLPITPVIDNELGYLDIGDASAWPIIDITVDAVIGNVTMIYADMTGNWGETSRSLDVDGYFSDGSDELTFGADAFDDQTGSSFEFGLGYGNFEASYNISDGQTGETLEVTFSDGTNTLVFSLALEGQFVGQDWVDVILAGSGITLNGELVADVEGWIGSDQVQMTITNATADPLTGAELAALEVAFVELHSLSELMVGFGQFAVELAWLSAP